MPANVKRSASRHRAWKRDVGTDDLPISREGSIRGRGIRDAWAVMRRRGIEARRVSEAVGGGGRARQDAEHLRSAGGCALSLIPLLARVRDVDVAQRRARGVYDGYLQDVI